MTAIHKASERGHSEVVALLLEAGATPTLQDKARPGGRHCSHHYLRKTHCVCPR